MGMAVEDRSYNTISPKTADSGNDARLESMLMSHVKCYKNNS